MQWQLRLTSLWAPVLVFVAAFAPYVTWTQLRPQDARWLQPVLKGFGLLMVVAFFGLLAFRLAARNFQRLRRARVDAMELTAQIRRELARWPDPAKQELAKDSAKARRELARSLDLSMGRREKVEEAIATVAQRWLERDPAALEAAATKLGEVSDKLLPGWRKRSNVEGARGLVVTLVVVILIRTLVAEPYKIPSGSMLPTLNVGDHVVVNRFVYGVRIPFINVVPFPIVRRPAKGDVIVFNNPADESKDFIKRVVGVPGDTVEIVNEVVHLNGVPQERQLVAEDFIVWDKAQDVNQWFEQHAPLYEETLAGVKHAVLQAPHHPRGAETQGPYVVPEGHVFVMGDNRDNSSDSRFNFGVHPSNKPAFVPYGHIKGKAMVVWLCIGHDGLLSGLPFWPFDGDGLIIDRLFLPVR